MACQHDVVTGARADNRLPTQNELQKLVESCSSRRISSSSCAALHPASPPSGPIAEPVLTREAALRAEPADPERSRWSVGMTERRRSVARKQGGDGSFCAKVVLAASASPRPSVSVSARASCVRSKAGQPALYRHLLPCVLLRLLRDPTETPSAALCPSATRSCVADDDRSGGCRGSRTRCATPHTTPSPAPMVLCVCWDRRHTAVRLAPLPGGHP